MNKIPIITRIAICVLFIVLISCFSLAINSDSLPAIFNSKGSLSMENSVEITKPEGGFLYIFDREIAPIGFTLIIGKITIEVEGSDDISGIGIYIDDQLKF